jgi:hypothetical protein
MCARGVLGPSPLKPVQRSPRGAPGQPHWSTGGFWRLESVSNRLQLHILQFDALQAPSQRSPRPACAPWQERGCSDTSNQVAEGGQQERLAAAECLLLQAPASSPQRPPWGAGDTSSLLHASNPSPSCCLASLPGPLWAGSQRPERRPCGDTQRYVLLPTLARPLPCHVIWPAQHSACQHSTAPATSSPAAHSHSYVGLGHCDRHSLQARAARQARGATATRVWFWRVGIHSTAAPLPGSRHIVNIFSNLLLQPGLAYCVAYTSTGCKLVP